MQPPFAQLTSTLPFAVEATAMVFVPVKVIPYAIKDQKKPKNKGYYTYRDLDASPRASKGIGIALVDDNTIFGASSRSVTAVGHTADGPTLEFPSELIVHTQYKDAPCSRFIGLDAKCLHVVDDSVVSNVNIRHNRSTGDRSNRDPMAAGAFVVLENNVGTLVDGQTVVLVSNNAVLNGHVTGGD
jgi:hypothetical protein